MKKRLILILFPLFIFFCLDAKSLALASEERQTFGIKNEIVNPGDDYKFIVKRLREKIELFLLSFSPSRKADYYSKLFAARLSELKYVVDRKDVANIQTTSQRYSATAGQLTEFIIRKDLKDRKKSTIDLLVSHIPILERLRDSYGGSDWSEWRFIQDDINSLKSYISKLSE